MQTIKLNLIPGSVLPVVNVSQYDAHRQFALQVYEGAYTYDLTGRTVEIRGTKPDGNGFAYDAQDGVVSVSGNTVTISTTQQMTAVGGQTMAELRITQSGVILGTLNFILMVEPSALSDDTPISETEIPVIERDMQAAVNQAEAAAQTATTQAGIATTKAGEASTSATNAATSATNAGNSATTASNAATTATTKAGEASTSANNAGNSATAAAADSLEAEGFAVGEQNGAPVGPTSPYYQNNAAYYAAQAGQYATGGLIFKGSVAFANIPTTGMVNGDMYNITDDFTTDSRFIEGAGVAVKAGADIAFVAGSVNKWDILALGGGSDDYSQLINKPQINSVELSGNKTAAALGLATDAAMTGASAGDAGAKGLVPAPAAGDQDKVLCGDGTWRTPSGSSDMTGATASTPGTHGLVPAPAAGDNTKFLRGDGTWAEVGGGGGSFSLSFWLSAGGLNPAAYADLAAVLADEEAVRRLMTIHLAVDYLASMTTTDADVTTILTSDICAKWINLRDYALDTLYDNALFASIMDMSGKYFLGEWALLSTSPDTWGPKGCVPIMTSNTAPYGEAFDIAHQSGSEAWHVFDGNMDNEDYWTAYGTSYATANAYVGYKFVNPVIVRRVWINFDTPYYARVKNFRIEASNDGSNYTTLYIGAREKVREELVIDIDNNTPYFYYRLFVVDSWDNLSIVVNNLQFYGRELKASVPVMTSNTAPYGVASGTIPKHSSSPDTFDYYKAFYNNDTNTSTNSFATNQFAQGRLIYKFPSTVVVKMAEYLNRANNIAKDMELQISNDGNTWETLDTWTNPNTQNTRFVRDVASNDTPGTYCAMLIKNTYTTTAVQITNVNFYGLDYSEYDWDADNPRHYLYDHGVEVETIATSGTVTKGADALTLSAANAQATNTLDLTAYDLLRAVVGQHFSGTTQLIAATTATGNMTARDAPYNEYLDISNVNASLATGAKMTSAGVCDVAEMWLE